LLYADKISPALESTMSQAAGLSTLTVGPEEAGRISGLTRDTIYNAIGRGELASFKVGRRRLILVKELEAWLNRMAKENAR